MVKINFNNTYDIFNTYIVYIISKNSIPLHPNIALYLKHYF